MKRIYGRAWVIGVMILLAIGTAGASAASDFSPGPNMPGNRVAPNVAPLPDGRVLVAGGYDGSSRLATAWVFDPSDESFTPTGSMATARQQSATVPIAGGKILVAGGLSNGGLRLNTAEIYDAASGTFSSLANTMSAVRQAPASALLPDGRVLIAGGLSGIYLSSAEIFDPATQTFSPTGSLNSPRAFAAAATLPDGRVLVASGMNLGVALNSAEIYNPATGQFSLIPATLSSQRSGSFALSLSDGKVIIGGGFDASASTARSDVEVFDPLTGTFSSFGSSIGGGRAYASTSTLQDGRAIVFGGVATFNGTPLNTTVYLFRPPAPTLTATPNPVVAGTNVTWTATTNNSGSSNVQGVTLSLPLPATTPFVSATASTGGACTTPAVGATGTVTCTWAGATAPTVSRSVDVVAQVQASATGTLAATVSASHDASSTPLTASVNTAITTTANLQLGLTANPTSVDASGGVITYVATAFNNGPSDAPALTVTIPFPPELGVTGAVASAGGSCSGTTTVTCTWPGATAPGESRTATITAMLKVSTSLALFVTASANSGATVTAAAARTGVRITAPIPVDDPRALLLMAAAMLLIGGAATRRMRDGTVR